jgi:hypothetical protein
MSKHTITVTTKVNGSCILQQVGSNEDEQSSILITHLIDTQDSQVRDALISLGWTPPE